MEHEVDSLDLASPDLLLARGHLFSRPSIEHGNVPLLGQPEARARGVQRHVPSADDHHLAPLPTDQTIGPSVYREEEGQREEYPGQMLPRDAQRPGFGGADRHEYREVSVLQQRFGREVHSGFLPQNEGDVEAVESREVDIELASFEVVLGNRVDLPTEELRLFVDGQGVSANPELPSRH